MNLDELERVYWDAAYGQPSWPLVDHVETAGLEAVAKHERKRAFDDLELELAKALQRGRVVELDEIIAMLRRDEQPSQEKVH